MSSKQKQKDKPEEKVKEGAKADVAGAYEFGYVKRGLATAWNLFTKNEVKDGKLTTEFAERINNEVKLSDKKSDRFVGGETFAEVKAKLDSLRKYYKSHSEYNDRKQHLFKLFGIQKEEDLDEAEEPKAEEAKAKPAEAKHVDPVGEFPHMVKEGQAVAAEPAKAKQSDTDLDLIIASLREENVEHRKTIESLHATYESQHQDFHSQYESQLQKSHAEKEEITKAHAERIKKLEDEIKERDKRYTELYAHSQRSDKALDEFVKKAKDKNPSPVQVALQPVAAKPAEAKPVEPVAAKPAEVKPVEAVAAKPVDLKALFGDEKTMDEIEAQYKDEQASKHHLLIGRNIKQLPFTYKTISLDKHLARLRIPTVKPGLVQPSKLRNDILLRRVQHLTIPVLHSI